ncbi:MAG: type II toxin-antitoxin system RelE/ParE family toxin [Saprospiraceae bacterium]|nr:type II toxin-antitoxin system RelE/ParE family toxin [Saprospiraceae bacterium]
MVQIKWLKSAKQDLSEIYTYISYDSSKYGKLQLIKIQNKIKILKKNIMIGKAVPELNRPDIRELVEGNYRIIYRVINSSCVHILLIHHSARDIRSRKL